MRPETTVEHGLLIFHMLWTFEKLRSRMWCSLHTRQNPWLKSQVVIYTRLAKRGLWMFLGCEPGALTEAYPKVRCRT